MFRSIFSNRNKNPIELLLFTEQRSNLLSTHLRFLHNRTPKGQSEELEEPIKDRSSFTVSYLINSCGLSSKSAVSAAKQICIKTPQNPDSTLSFLKSFGLTSTQIARVISKRPNILMSSVEKTLEPKLSYFLNAGFSTAQLAELLCLDTALLRSSLPNRLRPNFELLSSLIGDVQRTYLAFRRNYRLISSNLETNFLPNVKTLQSYEVPDEKITLLAACYPRVLMLPTEKFETVVASIAKFGFDPSSTLFVQGVSALGGLEPRAWEKKVALYRSLGWSGEEIISAFRKQPFFMSLSEKKVRKVTGFFVKEMNCSPSLLAAKPVLLCLSFETRILPRCSVLSVLVSKGLLTRELGHVNFLKLKNERFLARYVTKYAKQVPEILEVYEGKMKLQDLNIQFMKLGLPYCS